MNVCVQVWRLYDVGPRSVACPIVFLPPLSGTADVFFRQLLSLSSRGYRVLSVSAELPVSSPLASVRFISPHEKHYCKRNDDYFRKNVGLFWKCAILPSR